ncbi:XdhC family protein [Roseibium denhamense]|uniref:Predicted sulfurylase large subunit, molybdopterin cytosine dinucleotide biosynthesis n=1 Tax=Roseibium denhamense TaxID=76305 RepID=A0ABY1PK89_9HYPH|nr:XdhC family protein [Roseibium denhamense]MTI05921.1 XdhC family protein [Roseibium denhamense]SMP35784.1 predicted sulfurylase large subunit, molybdopterin cytosine dinucleotide biosynthesis [Roseibium denhamense]
MELSLLARLNDLTERRRAAIVVTNLSDNTQHLIERTADFSSHPLAQEFEQRFLSGKSGTVETEKGPVFLTVSVPPPRLVIIGAVHISQALVPMAEIAGLSVTVIDPRTAFATEDRFAGSVLKADWPEEALKDTPLDAFTAVAAVTHDPKIDDYPLLAALEANCFYVGALGSRKTHAKRLERLQKAGADPTRFSRLDAPIGLDIGAASPEEIAVAVLGSVIKAMRKPEADA